MVSNDGVRGLSIIMDIPGGYAVKTLYVSDLDGTLLRSNERTSEYTNAVINALTERGMIFSYATARSLSTAQKVTRGITAKIPLIVYNGAFIVNNATGEIMEAVDFGGAAQGVLRELMDAGVYPIVYAMVDGAEKFSYIPQLASRAVMEFVATRKGDRRDRPVNTVSELLRGNCFYITCIDEEAKLEPFYAKYRDTFHCVYQRDIYSGEQWLEIMPMEASKANAIRKLKRLMGCERLVVFGDGRNDIDMFELADESYAVENAVQELKDYATGVIGSNNDDAVAKWLSDNWQK